MAENEDDLEKLFIDDTPPAPSPGLADPSAPAGATGEPTLHATATDPNASASSAPRALGSLPIRQQIALDAAAGQNNAQGSTGMKYEPSTILESDAASLYRELSGIWHNIKLVCNPFFKPDDVTAMLKHWDLWGPLIFNLSLACLLSLESSEPQRTFCVVFIIVIAGALLLTVNVVLLGGAVSLLQSVSLLGYCMFPLDLAALICFIFANAPYHEVIELAAIAAAVLWAMHASVPFLAGTVGERRRWLAVYPIALMFAVLGWLIFIS